MTWHELIQPISTCLRPTDSLEDAVRVMLEMKSDAVPVEEDDGRLVGVFSQESLYKMILAKSDTDTPIRAFLTTEAVVIQLDKLSEMTEEQLEEILLSSPTDSCMVLDENQQIVGVLTKAQWLHAKGGAKSECTEQRGAVMQAANGRSETLCQQEEVNRFTEKATLKHPYHARYSWKHIITQDKEMKQCIHLASKTARHNTPLLLRGESGTGKELFAHAVHHASERAHGPFITVNCASIPEHLLEAEFFGYEPGAFTGADRAGRIGKLELARGGTLFLDEIGDMPLALQAKLLRVLEGQDFFRVGGSRPIQTDVRIISATHAPLEDMMAAKTFREDLYYRLHIITLTIPPLRQRKHDILLLADTFIQQLNPVLNTSVTGIEEAVQQALRDYDWPGNIRQLRNVIERGMIMAETGKITLVDLPDEIAQAATDVHGKKWYQDADKAKIERVLRETNGNKTKAAKMLGLSRSAFYEKLKKYQMGQSVK